MRNRWINLIFAMLAGFAASTTLLAQTAAQSGAKKIQTPASVPNLNGVWANITESAATFNPKEDPSFQGWAEVKWKANKNDDPAQRNTNGLVQMDPTVASCFPSGMPRLMTEVFPFEIIQVRDRILILFERDYAATRLASGTATRSSLKRSASKIQRGSIARGIHTATRCTLRHACGV